jgi:predicted dehydrogenase
MYITPEQAAVGRENFDAAMGSDTRNGRGVSRREFLKAAVAAALVPDRTLGASCFGYGSVAEPLRVGVIGTGDQGGVLIGAANPQYINVVAICDIRPFSVRRAFHGDYSSPAALKARCGLMGKYGWSSEDEARSRVRVYEDYQDMLRDHDVEAVIIALPAHLHAPVTIDALRSGKHVLVEKLMGQTVGQCKQVVRATRETGLVLSVGYQRHYSAVYAEAADMVRQGLLGDVHYIWTQWHRGNLPGADSWQAPLPPSVKRDDRSSRQLEVRLRAEKQKLHEAAGAANAELAARIAQLEAQIADENVDAAKFGYQRHEIKDATGNVVYECLPIEELIRWRLWDRTGTGLFGELGSHQIDGVNVLTSAESDAPKPRLVSVTGFSARSLFPADREVDDHACATFEFADPNYDAADVHTRRKRIAMQQSLGNGNGFGGYGEMLMGTKGTLIVQRETEAMLFDAFGPSVNKLRTTQQDDGPRLESSADGDPTAAALGRMATAEVSRGYREELEHWAWCIRNPDPGNRPRCDAKAGLANAVMSLTAERAARQGCRIDFREQWFDADSDETPQTPS